MQSCIHPQTGDLVPKRTWKCFKSSNRPFPTQQKDQLCPCSCFHPPVHRMVWRDEGCRVWALPKDPKGTQVGSPRSWELSLPWLCAHRAWDRALSTINSWLLTKASGCLWQGIGDLVSHCLRVSGVSFLIALRQIKSQLCHPNGTANTGPAAIVWLSPISAQLPRKEQLPVSFYLQKLKVRGALLIWKQKRTKPNKWRPNYLTLRSEFSPHWTSGTYLMSPGCCSLVSENKAKWLMLPRYCYIIYTSHLFLWLITGLVKYIGNVKRCRVRRDSVSVNLCRMAV